MEQSWIDAIFGGVIIGLAAGLLLMTYGRVLGISGISGRIIEFKRGETAWRVMFICGVMAGGFLSFKIWPDHFATLKGGSLNLIRVSIAGVIVGFGTRMGGGCTSGHGVCGIGRLSPRSIIATMIFIISGAITVAVIGR